jgi:hypothetical protein
MSRRLGPGPMPSSSVRHNAPRTTTRSPPPLLAAFPPPALHLPRRPQALRPFFDPSPAHLGIGAIPRLRVEPSSRLLADPDEPVQMWCRLVTCLPNGD